MSRRARERWEAMLRIVAHGWKRWLSIIYVVAAFGYGSYWVAAASYVGHVALMYEGPGDIVVDYRAAKAFHEGYNPFSPEGAVRSGLSAHGAAGNAHPPTTSFWLLPFTIWDLKAVQIVFGWGTLFLLLLQLLTLAKELECPAPIATTWLAFGYLATCPMVRYHLVVGQLSGSISALLFAGWYAGRRGRDELAGLAIGLAASMKLFPALVVLPFIFARRWRVVGFAMASFFFVAATMASRFGWGSWRFFFKQQQIASKFWISSIQNGSIHGVVQHLFNPVCVSANEFAGPLSKGISSIACVILMALAVRWAWPHLRRGSVTDETYALFVTLTVLSSEFTWEHYWLIFVFPLAIALAYLVKMIQTTSSLRARALAVTGLLAMIAVGWQWRQDIVAKQTLQQQYLAGDHQFHFQLHRAEILNWLPNVALLGCLMMVTALKSQQRIAEKAERSPTEPVGPAPSAAAVG